jgi:hypothetical protein
VSTSIIYTDFLPEYYKNPLFRRKSEERVNESVIPALGWNPERLRMGVILTPHLHLSLKGRENIVKLFLSLNGRGLR